MPTQEQRETAIRLKLNPVILEIKGKNVAVVDDSIVRGTTSKKIVDMLKKAGAKKVHFLVSCPPLTSPCFYAIDFADKDELIAAEKNSEITIPVKMAWTAATEASSGRFSAGALTTDICFPISSL